MRSADLDDLARRSAAMERRLFEIVGGWVPEVAEPEVKIALRAASFRHAWHAELWEGLVRPGVGGQAAVAEFSGLVEAATTQDRLAAFYGRVLPSLIEEYEHLAGEAAADVAAGGPLQRVLTLVLADDRAEVAAGRTLWHGERRAAP